MKKQRKIILIQLILNLGLLIVLLLPLIKIMQSNTILINITLKIMKTQYNIYLSTLVLLALFNFKNILLIKKHIDKRFIIDSGFLIIITISLIRLATSLPMGAQYVYLYLLLLLIINILTIFIYTNIIKFKMINLMINKINLKHLFGIIFIFIVLTLVLRPLFLSYRYNHLQIKHNELTTKVNTKCTDIIDMTNLNRQYNAIINDKDIHEMYSKIPDPSCRDNFEINNDPNHEGYNELKTKYNYLNDTLILNQALLQEQETKLEQAETQIKELVTTRKQLSTNEIKTNSRTEIDNYINNTLKPKGYTVPKVEYNAIWMEQNTHIRVYYTLTLKSGSHKYTDVVIVDYPVISYQDKIYENGKPVVSSTYETTYENAIQWFKEEKMNMELK